MLGGKPITLFRVGTIRIEVDWSWFFILFLFIVWQSQYYADVLGESGSSTAPFGLAVAAALGFFGSIVLHELGHAVVALRNGIGIASIRLWIFGGMARMDRETHDPRAEFEVAIGGPVVTLAIVLVLLAIELVAGGSQGLEDSIPLGRVPETSGVLAMLGWLAFINFLVLAFNLLPAFPMDGGRIVRAIAWWRTGDRTAATRIAAGLGRAFSYLFVACGLLLIFEGEVFAGVWLGVIGFVINGSARAAAAQTAITGRIEGIRVADIMDREPVAISDRASVEEALDDYFLRYRWAWFPVVDTAHRFIGLVVRDKADEVPETSRATSLVADVVELDDGTFQVREDAPLDSLLANRALRRFGALMAIDAEGRLSGVITAEQVGRALRDAAS